MPQASVGELVEDLFRRESAHLVSALVRLLGPSNLTLAEDVVHDALISAMHAWRFGPPDDPKAWILHVAKHRAIDAIRRDRRLCGLPEIDEVVELALSPQADAENQLAMMFAICDDGISPETHVTLILRFLCGLSAAEIARAFLVEVQTIDRRLHRGKARLRELGELHDVNAKEEVRARQPSVEQALYLLFNEGYQGPNPAMCADAIRLAEMLLALAASAIEPSTVHALLALFCFNAARLPTRLDEEGVLVPLADQDRSRWNQSLVARGVQHLGASAAGDQLTRWHLEAGIAFEHTNAPSVKETNWEKIVEYYDALMALSPSPVVALNRGLALAEARGLALGNEALVAIVDDPKLESYSFYWAARADIERRIGNVGEARSLYERAISFAKTKGERLSYERRVRLLGN